ncbi:hypothetical protein HO133_010095 [Letharia lupina]|uniref:Vps72/YL1 C-terminal domain-containing protein n=1 Tax=Letharia lupina TaxID=560253 RepID=A0A8H6FEA4_9LECA|nr:uncharacterized protein HO133_010095 [Letharia lupina]KAF6224901.1 hypothetical protein HO133_010095 [Letharia lupina]
MSGDASPAPSSDRGNESTSSDGDAEEEPNVESLVTGRAKRATAGNRLSSLLEKEGDDDLELLFAENEGEEDVEFEDEDENASDAQLDSSTDEEDQGPTKVDDDEDGERELQRQDRFERQKKRKAQEVFKKPGLLRKKVKIDPSATPTTPAPRPRKKSERVSWVHTDADAPTRVSSRKQTVQNRELVHQKLVDSEQTRLKIMHSMDLAQKRKDASKPKALTQADRMEEAAKTERKNAKSLNRWEESEKKRSEEQRAKLEALHNRQLAGPVVTWWSGLARWVNGKILQLGVGQIREAGHAERPVMLDEGKSALNSKMIAEQDSAGTKDEDIVMSESSRSGLGAGNTQHSHLPDAQQASFSQQITFTAPQVPHGFLDGIHAYAALPVQQHQAEFTGTADADSLPQHYPEPSFPKQLEQASLAAPPNSYSTPEVDINSRTLVAIKNFDPNPMKMPELQTSVLLKKRNVKPAKPVSESCAITMQPAKFRDPKTGLAYANSYAYKEIQRLRTGASRWSNLLDCYVGPVQSVARGVPERFWKET